MAKKKLLKGVFKKAFGKESPLKKVLIEKGLPLLANVVTGGAAGPVINIVKDIVGAKSSDPAELEKAIKENPDVLVKLKEFETNQKIELERLALRAAELDMEETKAYIGDVQDARDRELEIIRATGKRDWLMMSLAIVVVLGFFGLVAYMVSKGDTIANNGPINQLFGALVAGFSMVLSYFFGSSKGSADKNTIMAHQSFRQSTMKEDKSYSNAKG